jgi:hypothetical protein
MRIPRGAVACFNCLPSLAPSRLWTTASRPHFPGCSMRSQARTRDAVPYSGSPSERAISEQRGRLATRGLFQKALSNQTTHEHQPALGIEVRGEIGDRERWSGHDEVDRGGGEGW